MPHSTLIEDKPVSSPPVPGAFDGIEKSAEIAVENLHLGGERPSLVGLTRSLLGEKLKDIGVDVVLSYTGNPSPQYPSSSAYLIDRLKK